MAVKVYSCKKNGALKLSDNFRVREFRCKDGSDKILIADELVTLLQKIRTHFGKPVTINSAYRNTAYNAKVGGVKNSQHVQGKAADIVVSGVTPYDVAKYAESIGAGGIGLYKNFTHIDCRLGKSRWDQRTGKQVVVSTFKK